MNNPGRILLCFLVAHSHALIIESQYGLKLQRIRRQTARGFSVVTAQQRGRLSCCRRSLSERFNTFPSQDRGGSLVMHMKSALEERNQGDKDESDDRGRRRFFHPIRRLFRQRIPQTLTKFRTRFAAWPKRLKRLFGIQILIMSLLLGYMGQTIYVSAMNRNPIPVEVSYSSFLDVLEQQKTNAGIAVPTMANVRIGEDRIQYRLERIPTTPNDNTNTPVDKTNNNNNNSKRIQLELPSVSSRHLKQLLRHQERQSYLSAFTRIVSAPPGLIQQLRDNGVSFSAMKSVMTTFYFLFMFRLYKSMTGKGKTDSPGKLAQKNTLASASFDDIEGIDSAKYEVMELVDALRNPKSYALFGARAPTGLLLVGPPGTG
jgi:hypothetical protein